jgi:hypothetical protein
LTCDLEAEARRGELDHGGGFAAGCHVYGEDAERFAEMAVGFLRHRYRGFVQRCVQLPEGVVLRVPVGILGDEVQEGGEGFGHLGHGAGPPDDDQEVAGDDGGEIFQVEVSLEECDQCGVLIVEGEDKVIPKRLVGERLAAGVTDRIAGRVTPIAMLPISKRRALAEHGGADQDDSRLRLSSFSILCGVANRMP